MQSKDPRFPSKLLTRRVPFFLVFCFNKETAKYKGKKGTIGVPRNSVGMTSYILIWCRNRAVVRNVMWNHDQSSVGTCVWDRLTTEANMSLS